MRTISIVVIMVAIAQGALAQTFREQLVREATFEKKSAQNAVLVDNINGNIQVMGYEGDKVIVQVEKIIQAKTEERLEKGKQQIQLGFIDRADTLIFYVIGTCATFGESKDSGVNRWRYNCNQSYGRDTYCDDLFDHRMNFVLKVPFATHVNVRTINEGDVTVDKVKGIIHAENINGSVRLSSLTKKAYATTINGDVDITYDHNPDSDCRFYTLNGNINANFQKGLSANLSFESFNGAFFTNLNLESLPAIVEKSDTKKGIKYKVNGNRYKVGNGGNAHLDFETFNGNVYLKENAN